MLNFSAIIENEYKSAYESAYDLSLKKPFSNPKIYTGQGDLSKRWYVYFSYRDPSTGKLKRQTPFYGNVNTYKTKEERMAALNIYRTAILKYLRLGYSPYEDNSERYHAQPSEQAITMVKVEDANVKIVQTEEDKEVGITITEAIKFDLAIKKRTLRDSSLRSFNSHLNVFRGWLEQNHAGIKYIKQVDKKLVSEFLNHILETGSARNRNNYRASMSSFFQCMVDNEIVDSNFISSIRILRSSPKRNKIYSREQQEAIFSYLEKEDPLMLLYVKFVSYNFLRPLEVCRLKVGDIDLAGRTLSFKAKNSPLKTKIIPEILARELPDLTNMDKQGSLFTPDGIGKEWDTKLENKRGYFTKRFSKTVKKKFGLELEHTLYSFRHTFITKLYKEMAKHSTPFETKSRLMQITGHSSMRALEKYLRDLDTELPQDYSQMLEN